MNRLALLILVAGALPLAAQQPFPTPAPTTAQANAFAIRPPDENSPFFLDPLAARALTREGVSTEARDPDLVAEYPKNRGSDDSAGAQIRKFFSEMFSSVNIGPLRTPPVTTKLEVDPATFPLQDRREVSVTYTIHNNSKKIMRLEYPTTQRVDIVTYDSQGKVIDKWSEDRTFESEEGIVLINPKERIEYQEKIPTREMKAGEQYRVDVLTTSEPSFVTQKTISPQ